MEVLRRPPGHSSTGQSLVEVLIAATILVSSLMASMQSQMSSVRLMKSARETELATEILQEAMAQAFLASNAELAGEGGAFAPGTPIAVQRVLDGQDVRYTLPEIEGGAAPGFLAVEFRVTWTAFDGQARSQTLIGGKR